MQDHPTRRAFLAHGASIGGSSLTIATPAEPTSRWKDVRDFGVSVDNDADQTAALQQAHDSGGLIYYPEGTYNFTALTLASGGIVGAGPGTVLKAAAMSKRPAVTHTGHGASEKSIPVFRNFKIEPSGNLQDKNLDRTAIRIGASQEKDSQLFAIFEDIHFRNWHTAIDTTNSSSLRIVNCDFFFYNRAAIVIANDVDGDAGDSLIMGCHFFNGTGEFASRGIAILQLSSGGLRINSNKFNGGKSAFVLDLKKNTSIIIIGGNSIENTSGQAVVLSNTSNTVTKPIRFEQVVINANQFARNMVDIDLQRISNYLNSSYWDGILISANVFFRERVDPSIIINTARDVMIVNNLFIGTGSKDVLAFPSVQNLTFDGK